MNCSEALSLSESLALYAEVVWPAGALVELRPLPTERGASMPGWCKRMWVIAEAVPTLADELARMNTEGEVNIFAGVLPRIADGGGADADCASGSVVWVDADGADKAAMEDLFIDRNIPRPTMLIESGHGMHAYWRVNGVVFPAKLSALSGDLAALLGTDQSVRNASRIMRLPGFTNLKPPPAPCEIVDADPARRYDFLVLRGLVDGGTRSGRVAPAGAGIMPPSTDARAKLLDRAESYVLRIPGESEGGRNQAAYRVACILRNEYALSEAEARPILAGWNARCSPPMDAKELDAVLASGAKYALKPKGCKVPVVGVPPPLSQERSSLAPTAIPLPAASPSELPAQFAAEGRGEHRTLSLPWPQLSQLSRALKPGTVLVLAGPPGYGKTWLWMETTIHLCVEHGVDFAHLPLEDSKAFWESRLLARLSSDWHMMDDDAANAHVRLAAHDKYTDDLYHLMRGVCENPGRAIKIVEGVEAVPFLPPKAAIDWIKRASAEYRVVSIDPLSLIDWRHDGESENDAQKRFMAHVLAISSRANNTVVLVCHTVKRPGRSAGLCLTQEDVQGSKMFTNVSHTVLLLDSHPKKESPMVCGMPQWHSRTLVIGKARNGPGSHSQIAMEFKGPQLEELGVIAPKQKKGGAS